MEHIKRIQFALEHVTHKSVFIVTWPEWEKIVKDDGESVRFISLPQPLSGLSSMASNVMVAGSGIFNQNPGIDVVREHLADYPYIYNIDHYTVIEHFTSSTLYKDAIRIAGVEDSEDLSEYIESHVFVVGPFQESNHWEESIPEQIRNAKIKE